MWMDQGSDYSRADRQAEAPPAWIMAIMNQHPSSIIITIYYYIYIYNDDNNKTNNNIIIYCITIIIRNIITQIKTIASDNNKNNNTFYCYHPQLIKIYEGPSVTVTHLIIWNQHFSPNCFFSAWCRTASGHVAGMPLQLWRRTTKSMRTGQLGGSNRTQIGSNRMEFAKPTGSWKEEKAMLFDVDLAAATFEDCKKSCVFKRKGSFYPQWQKKGLWRWDYHDDDDFDDDDDDDDDDFDDDDDDDDFDDDDDDDYYYYDLLYLQMFLRVTGEDAPQRLLDCPSRRQMMQRSAICDCGRMWSSANRSRVERCGDCEAIGTSLAMTDNDSLHYGLDKYGGFHKWGIPNMDGL